MSVKRAARGFGIILALILAWGIYTGAQIIGTARENDPRPADAAIVLGAAIYRDRPSPVFEQRIIHGITLYKSGKARALIMTGGFGEGEKHAEAHVARAYALRAGVPAGAILIEDRSKTTSENLKYAQPILARLGAKTVTLVTDPLHSHRALLMAKALAMDARSSPTPTSRYQSTRAKADFLAREIYFTTVFQVFGK